MLACVGLSTVAFSKDTEPAWIEVHAQHFPVYTEPLEKRGKEVALRFEQMRSVFAGLLLKERLTMPLPTTILALKDNQEYLRIAPVVNGHPTTSPGFLVAQQDQVYIVVDTSEA